MIREISESVALLARNDRVPCATWFREHFFGHDERPFDEYQTPWVTAPHGPCWAIDNPRYRRIWLQWAARMFKTNFAQGVALMYAATDPCNQMCASVDESNVKQVMSRTWMMISASPRLRDEAPVPRLRSRTEIKLARSRIYGAWPLSKSKLRDKAIRVGHANEIDGWEHESTSHEGDPVARFLKRLDEYPDSKAILESTPTRKSASRVERGRLSSTNHTYHVPCPHCGKFQKLVLGDGKEPPGLFWVHDEAGRSDADKSLHGTYYVCAHCKRDIQEQDKGPMMALGVWVPEGCQVDHDRAIIARSLPPDDTSWLIGTPMRDYEDYGSQLSVLYALFQGWGSFARRWIRAKSKPSEMRQAINEDLAETTEVISRKTTWENLYDRLISAVPWGVVPNGMSLVTLGVDKQEDHYVWVADSWGEGRTSHTLAYGTFDTIDTIAGLMGRQWTHQDGGAPIAISCTLIDSRYRPAEVYRFVRVQRKKNNHKVYPCFGSTRSLGAYFALRKLGENTAMPGLPVVHVDTVSSQDWIDKQLHSLDKNALGKTSIYMASKGDHQDFLEQLLNDAAVSGRGSDRNTKETWQRIDESIPNDYRDAKRYAAIAALVASRQAPITPRQSPTSQKSLRAPQKQQPKRKPNRLISRPGGWLKGMK